MGTLLAPYWWVGRPITFSRNCCWLRESVSWFDLNDRDLAFPFLLVASSLPHILLLSRGVKVHQKELGQRTAFASLFWPFLHQSGRRRPFHLTALLLPTWETWDLRLSTLQCRRTGPITRAIRLRFTRLHWHSHVCVDRSLPFEWEKHLPFTQWRLLLPSMFCRSRTRPPSRCRTACPSKASQSVGLPKEDSLPAWRRWRTSRRSRVERRTCIRLRLSDGIVSRLRSRLLIGSVRPHLKRMTADWL